MTDGKVDNREANLTYTPLEEIDAKIDLCNSFFHDKQLKLSQERSPRKADLKYRLVQLKKLYYAIKDNSDAMVGAMFSDFHRSKQESLSLELIQTLNNVLYMIENLSKWMKPSKLKDCSPPYTFGSATIERIARGSVLIIAPFNFPIHLALAPVAYAIAAGNSVILKPSEMTPATARLIEKIVAQADLPDGLVQVVQGSISETNRLVKSGKFDMIFFTGSPRVGSIIAQEAAKTITPCVLELGGKSPVFLTKNLRERNFRTVLKRVFFSAFGNSGQICVSPDYVMVHESIYPKIVEEAKQVLLEFFPEINPDVEYTHMIDKRAYDNAVSKLESTDGRRFTIDKQTNDAQKLVIPPTLVFDVAWNDSLMKSEIFAPILPFVKYSKLDNAIDKILEEHDTPLVQYIFSERKEEVNHILTRLRSGDCIVGDTLIHIGISDAPFGGIGQSGYGNYGGVWGFNAFSHQRTVFKQPYWLDIFFSMRYPPFKPWKTEALQFAMERKPWFDRNGNDKLPYLKWLTLSAAAIYLAIFLKFWLPDSFPGKWWVSVRWSFSSSS